MAEISVIMPVYNAQAFLNKSIRSIINQTFTDFELILVNDGSTDYSLFYCNAFAKRDNRIKVLDLSHSGVAAARNQGITAAKGKYIGFVDSDDWVEREYLEHLHSAAISSHADITICHTVCEFSNGSLPMYIPLEKGIFAGKTLEKIKHSVLLGTNVSPFPCALSPLWDKLIKNELIQNNLKYMNQALTIGEDTVLSTACILDSSCICVIGNADYHYLKRTGSLLHTINENADENFLIFQKAIYAILNEKKYCDLTEKANNIALLMLEQTIGVKCIDGGIS